MLSSSNNDVGRYVPHRGNNPMDILICWIQKQELLWRVNDIDILHWREWKVIEEEGDSINDVTPRTMSIRRILWNHRIVDMMTHKIVDMNHRIVDINFGDDKYQFLKSF